MYHVWVFVQELKGCFSSVIQARRRGQEHSMIVSSLYSLTKGLYNICKLGLHVHNPECKDRLATYEVTYSDDTTSW